MRSRVHGLLNECTSSDVVCFLRGGSIPASVLFASVSFFTQAEVTSKSGFLGEKEELSKNALHVIIYIEMCGVQCEARIRRQH